VVTAGLTTILKLDPEVYVKKTILSAWRIISSLLATVVLVSPSAVAQTDLDLANISMPPGFSIEIWSDEVPNARSMALGANGTVFVATRRDGRVYGLVPVDGSAPTVVTLAEGLKMPNGIAFHDGDLYVAENHRITRYDDIENRLGDIPEPVVVIDSLSTERHHGWRYIDVGPDGKLYVTIGAPCNVCERDGFANIIRMDIDGTNQEVVASGIRNSVGLAWQPSTGDLWFTDNGRDMLGDDIPAGELNHVTRDGMHFGFPYCHGGDIPDPDFGVDRDCAEFVPPAQKLGPHVAPLGIIFYTGDMFPDEYSGQVFIAEHGSWNRSRKIGYRVSIVHIDGAKASDYDGFAEGWLQGEEVAGRPVDLLVLADGSLLVSDDQNGVVYRITYSRPLNEGVALDDTE
jgi:glucose/arabinose dehydrogenase